MANYKNPVLQSGEHQTTSPFGLRTHPVTGAPSTMHTGIDLVRTGGKLDYIIAFADGTVAKSKYSTNGGGEFIQIDHGNGCSTRYLHLKSGSRTVKAGQAVKKGQVLGYMGATGNVTGAHLHFDINIDGKYVDPVPYLEGEKEFTKKPTVLEWQKAAIADGFEFPKWGADGKWGSECEEVAKKAVVKKRILYTNKNLTKIVQRVVGVDVDGKCGSDTKAGIIAYQKKNGLEADGCVGLHTWKKILGV